MIVTRPQPPPSKKQTRLFVSEEKVDDRASGSSAKRSKTDEADASNTTDTSASKRRKSSKTVEADASSTTATSAAASAGPSTVKAKPQRKGRSLAN